MILDLTDADATTRLGAALAPLLGVGDAVLLRGPLGMGKSTLARGLIRALTRPDEDVPSPTFTLVQTYDDPMGTQIWHADLYRLTDPSELTELGLDEAMDDAICLIEWPDRLDGVPPGARTIALLPQPDPDLRLIAMDFPGADRLAARAAFVVAAGQAEARVQPLAGDASARRYYRLPGVGVLMDDPSGSVAPFLAMTDWLRGHGFGAPAVLAQDSAQGFLLLEDLGDDLVARVLERAPALAPQIHDRITDLLVALHRLPVPDSVAPLGGPAMGDLAALFSEYYPDADLPGLPALIAELHDRLCRDLPPAISLRDFHAENLVWRGDAPLGLLDFQDAVAAHPAYDLVSALQDARRDVDPATEQVQIARYLAATGADQAAFRAAYALIGAQRALRILGVFVRLAVRDGKPRYLAFMPRVWAHLQRNLAHPALAPLRDALVGVPAPDVALRERIAQCRP